MKPNEAPKKIYVCDNVFPTHVDWDGSPINTKKIDDSDIEYTQTDAFVEKACKWLKENADHYVGHYLNDDDTYMDESFIEDFEKYMKEE